MGVSLVHLCISTNWQQSALVQLLTFRFAYFDFCETVLREVVFAVCVQCIPQTGKQLQLEIRAECLFLVPVVPGSNLSRFAGTAHLKTLICGVPDQISEQKLETTKKV